MNRYVHEFRGRFVVAERRGKRYYAPMRPELRRLTGCHTIYGSLEYVSGNAYTYKHRRSAVHRAYQLYGC